MCLNVARGLWLVINESLDLLLLTMLFETSAISTEFCTFAYRFCLLRVCPPKSCRTWGRRSIRDFARSDLCLMGLPGTLSTGTPQLNVTFTFTFTFICALSARSTTTGPVDTPWEAQTHNRDVDALHRRRSRNPHRACMHLAAVPTRPPVVDQVPRSSSYVAGASPP